MAERETAGNETGMVPLEGVVGGADVMSSCGNVPALSSRGVVSMHRPVAGAQLAVEGVVNMAENISSTQTFYYHKPQVTANVVNATRVSVQDSSGYPQLKDQSHEEIHYEKDFYTQTSGYDKALKMLEEHGLLIITGPSGSGKTTLGRALLRSFENTDRTPLVLHRYEEFRQHVGGQRRQVILIDDEFGKEEFSNSKFLDWVKALPLLRGFVECKKCLAVLICRSEVLCGLELMYNRKDVFEGFQILDAKMLAPFTDDEKKEMIRRHFQTRGKQPPKSQVEDILALDFSRYLFPLRCKEYVTTGIPDFRICTEEDTSMSSSMSSTEGIDPEETGTQLMDAIDAEDFDRIDDLLNRGVSADTKDSNENLPLHIASKCGYDRVVRMLLLFGSAINARDSSQLTALHFACLDGHHNIVKTLVEKGAMINVKDEDGWTPLHLCSKGNPNIADTLLAFGAELNVTNERGETPLHIACESNGLEIATILLEKDAEKDIKDERGMTPLHTACTEGHENIVRLLIENDFNIESECDEMNTPLHLACFGNHPVAAGVLLQNGALVNAKNALGETALAVASLYGFEELVKLLLSHKADPNAQDDFGNTSLHYAAFKEHTIVARLLVQNGARVNNEDAEGRAALAFASFYGFEELVTLLLSHGADPNAQDDCGRTPLHHAASRGNTSVAQLLIADGADVNAQDDNNLAPLCLAFKQDVIALLLDHGADATIGSNTMEDRCIVM